MISRRDFLKTCGVVGISFVALKMFAETLGTYEKYGPIIADPKGILSLPKGFSYKIISKKGQTMNDGLLVPGFADGMAAFAGKNDKVVLIRNHEIHPMYTSESPFGQNYELLDKVPKQKIYDYGSGKTPGLGGTTTIVYNPKTQKTEKQFLSLAGTSRNCAGGPTPWNSWISCEETVEKAGNHSHLRKNTEQEIKYTMDQNHGYNFEVPATEEVSLVTPIPLKEMGRFNHEAVAVDPNTGIVYQTEDRDDGLIYRYIPNEPGKLHQGGKLQALALAENPSFDTRNWSTPKFPVAKPMAVTWIDMKDIDPPQDDLRHRGFKNGATRFARGEGMWYGKNELFFACTNGGDNKRGQIFRYVPSKDEGKSNESKNPGQLELFIEPNNTKLMKSADNLTVAPWGDLFVCEDRKHSFIVGVTAKGQIFKFAENIGFESEFAGATFAPHGETLFVNLQRPGFTFAITGPFKQS